MRAMWATWLGSFRVAKTSHDASRDIPSELGPEEEKGAEAYGHEEREGVWYWEEQDHAADTCWAWRWKYDGWYTMTSTRGGWKGGEGEEHEKENIKNKEATMMNFMDIMLVRWCGRYVHRDHSSFQYWTVFRRLHSSCGGPKGDGERDDSVGSDERPRWHHGQRWCGRRVLSEIMLAYSPLANVVEDPKKQRRMNTHERIEETAAQQNSRWETFLRNASMREHRS